MKFLDDLIAVPFLFSIEKMENLLKAARRLYKFGNILEKKEMARLLSVSVKTVSNYGSDIKSQVED